MSGSTTFSSLQDLVKRFESNGNYSAVNGNHFGAYQFSPSTWLQYAPSAGVDTAQYPTAQGAPPDVQDKVFNQAVASNGLGDWTCSGCNPQLSAYLAANPDARNLPVSSGSSTTAPTTGTSTSSSSGGTPGQIVGSALSGALSGLTGAAGNAGFYMIGILIVLVLLVAGLIGLVRG